MHGLGLWLYGVSFRMLPWSTGLLPPRIYTMFFFLGEEADTWIKRLVWALQPPIARVQVSNLTVMWSPSVRPLCEQKWLVPKYLGWCSTGLILPFSTASQSEAVRDSLLNLFVLAQLFPDLFPFDDLFDLFIYFIFFHFIYFHSSVCSSLGPLSIVFRTLRDTPPSLMRSRNYTG